MADADSPCAALVACENLSGGVFVRRTIYGPSLIDDPRPLAFGEFSLSGGAIRPYIDLMYETRWIPKGLCRGPVSSVMSLAPTESITTGIRTEHRDSFTQMMTDSAESSSVHTRTRHQLSESTGQGSGGGGLGSLLGGLAGAAGAAAGAIGAGVGKIANAVGGVAGDVFGVEKDIAGAVLDLGPMFIGRLGSIFEDIGSVAGDIVGAVVGAPVAIASGAANAITGLIDGAIGGIAGAVGQGPALVDTHHRLNEITESMEKRESQSHVRQIVVSTTNTREEFVTRTFSNPYRDRSLQLRFVPVYRHFEVVTTIRFGVHGLAMLAGKLDTNVQRAQSGIASQFGLASRLSVANTPSLASAATTPAAPAISRLVSAATVTKVALASAQVNHDDTDVRRPMVDLLVRNTSGGDREKGVHVEQGLRWSGAQVRDNVLHVPAAEPAILGKAWHLDDRVAGRLGDAISRLSADRLVALAPKIETRQIHIFAGTHVEAVPGECTLPDILTDALKPPANA
ncbi:MAG: hypothetical protein ACJ8KX_03350 [Chthoniobacterales bacterium]